MSPTLRRPSGCELAIQVAIGALFAFFLAEYLNARDASSCFQHAASRVPAGCYPWGMTEGPMEGYSWSYASKENYLRSLLVQLGMLTTAFLSPLVTPRPRVGLSVMLVLIVLGVAGADWLAALL